MLSKILTTAALIGMAIAAATPSTASLNLALLQARQAAEAPRLAASGIVLHHTETLPDGYFVEIYGSIENSTFPAVQHQQFARAPLCGGERLECDYSFHYGVKEEVTKRLIRHLFDRKDWTPRQPRSFCLYGDQSRACVSWNRDVGTFPWAWLAPATQRIGKSAERDIRVGIIMLCSVAAYFIAVLASVSLIAPTGVRSSLIDSGSHLGYIRKMAALPTGGEQLATENES